MVKIFTVTLVLSHVNHVLLCFSFEFYYTRERRQTDKHAQQGKLQHIDLLLVAIGLSIVVLSDRIVDQV